MIRAVVERDLHIHHGIAGQHAALHGALNTGIHRRNIFLGDGAAHGAVDELIALAGFVGLQRDLHMGILTGAAGLTLILGLVVDLLPDGLLIGDLRRAHIGFHLELAQQAVHDDLQMMVWPVSASV